MISVYRHHCFAKGVSTSPNVPPPPSAKNFFFFAIFGLVNFATFPPIFFCTNSHKTGLWISNKCLPENWDTCHTLQYYNSVSLCPVTVHPSVSCRQRDYRKVHLCAGRHISPSECLYVFVCVWGDSVCVCSSNLSLSWLSPPVDLLPCCRTWTAPLSLASPSPSLLWFLPVCVILHNSGVIDHPLSSSGETCELWIFIIADVKRKRRSHTHTDSSAAHTQVKALGLITNARPCQFMGVSYCSSLVLVQHIFQKTFTAVTLYDRIGFCHTLPFGGRSILKSRYTWSSFNWDNGQWPGWLRYARWRCSLV